MHKYLWILIGMLSGCVYAQNSVQGRILDEFNEPLPDAVIRIDEHTTQTNEQGNFSSEQMLIYQTEITIPTSEFLNIVLPSDSEELDEIVIHATHAKTYNETVVNNQNIIENYSGSLASSLTNVAGVQSSDIGSGNSKPIIRGLGLNRVAVSENGIKQEGQQWGADHGLEMDALQTEKVEI